MVRQAKCPQTFGASPVVSMRFEALLVRSMQINPVPTNRRVFEQSRIVRLRKA